MKRLNLFLMIGLFASLAVSSKVIASDMSGKTFEGGGGNGKKRSIVANNFLLG